MEEYLEEKKGQQFKEVDKFDPKKLNMKAIMEEDDESIAEFTGDDDTGRPKSATDFSAETPVGVNKFLRKGKGAVYKVDKRKRIEEKEMLMK